MENEYVQLPKVISFLVHRNAQKLFYLLQMGGGVKDRGGDGVVFPV